MRGVAVRSSRAGDEAAIRAVALATLQTDPVPGVDARHVDRAIDRLAADRGGTVVALEGAEIVGYCTPRLNDLSVHPEHRRRGHGRRLVQAALEVVRARRLPYLMLYAPLDRPGARAFVDAVGLRYHSSLWQFALAPDIVLPPPSFPPSVATRTFTPADLEAYVELLNDTFAEHPTPLTFTVDAVRFVHGLPEFDPAGVLLVTPADDPKRFVAFIRTELSARDDGQREGDIALVGVRSEWRGLGLGRELLRWGVATLRRGGAPTITLSVEALNERATAIYRSAGFVPSVEWPHVVLPA
jgi:mycothiol synthase